LLKLDLEKKKSIIQRGLLALRGKREHAWAVKNKKALATPDKKNGGRSCCKTRKRTQRLGRKGGVVGFRLKMVKVSEK